MYPNGTNQGIDPATVQAILALQQEAPEQQRIARQLKLAEQLRADAGGGLEGRTVGAKGRERYIAPNALNLAGSIGQNFMAARQGQQADTAATALGNKRAAAMKDFFDALTKGNKMVTNTPPAPDYSPQGHGAPF